MSRRLALLLAVVAHCEAGTPPEDLRGHHARRISGALGVSSEVTPLLGLFTLTAGVNDVPTPMLVDTGAPLTFVNPGGSLSRGPQRLRSLTIAGATLFDVPVVGDDPFGLAPLVGGVLGVNVICQFNATWDWRRRRFTLGDTPQDAEVVEQETVIPFVLRGGGTFRVSGVDVRVPPTRIIVEGEVEGQRLALVLDTGASTSALRDDLVASLAGDRPSVTVRVGSPRWI